MVSITVAGDVARVRRYERCGKTGRLICTHAGIYDHASVTATNVHHYHASGAPQDRLRARHGKRRLTA